MTPSAKLSRISFYFLLINFVVIATASVLRPVFATQTADDKPSGTNLEVQVPADPPSLKLPEPNVTSQTVAPQTVAPQTVAPQTTLVPSRAPTASDATGALQSTGESTVDSSTATTSPGSTDSPITTGQPTTTESPVASRANRMVMDELLKVIQDSHGALDVPPLSYAPLPMKSAGAGSGSIDLQQMQQRMKSIAAITQSAQILIKEAQQLHASGNANAARELTEHVQTLKNIILQLSAESAEPANRLPTAE